MIYVHNNFKYSRSQTNPNYLDKLFGDESSILYPNYDEQASTYEHLR